MIIKKILNNNVIISENARCEEIIAMGRGLAFQKKIGDHVQSEQVDKIFIVSSDQEGQGIEEVIRNVDSEIAELSKEIILLAESTIGSLYSDKFYIILTDHLNYAISRIKEGVFIPNPLVFEIKKFYPEEFKVAKEALRLIESTLGIVFPEDEAGFIALHLASNNNEQKNLAITMESTEIVRDVLMIISRFFGVPFNENATSYHRMVTHIQYFVKRILNNEAYEAHDEFLYELVKSKYPEAYNCSLRIRDYLKKTRKITIQDSEMIYLIIHINRVVKD